MSDVGVSTKQPLFIEKKLSQHSKLFEVSESSEDVEWNELCRQEDEFEGFMKLFHDLSE